MLKNAIAKIKNAIRASKDAITPKPASQPAPGKPFQRVANDIAKYIYLNPGLNRHERRALDAKIRSKRIRKSRRKPSISPAEKQSAAWSLRNTPINQPATRVRLNENSRLRRAGEAIKVWARENTRRDKVSA